MRFDAFSILAPNNNTPWVQLELKCHGVIFAWLLWAYSIDLGRGTDIGLTYFTQKIS